MSSLFPQEVPAAPSLFSDSPAAPEPYSVKRNGASWSVIDPDGMLALAFPCGSESRAREYAASLNAAFGRGWSSRERLK